MTKRNCIGATILYSCIARETFHVSRYVELLKISRQVLFVTCLPCADFGLLTDVVCFMLLSFNTFSFLLPIIKLWFLTCLSTMYNVYATI